MIDRNEEFKPSWDGSKSLGEQSRWEIFKFLLLIGDIPGAISVLFRKRDRNGNLK